MKAESIKFSYEKIKEIIIEDLSDKEILVLVDNSFLAETIIENADDKVILDEVKLRGYNVVDNEEIIILENDIENHEKILKEIFYLILDNKVEIKDKNAYNYLNVIFEENLNRSLGP